MGILLIDVITAQFAIIPLIFIHVPQPQKNHNTNDLGFMHSVWSDLMAGFLYVWNWKGFRILILWSSIVVLFVVPSWILLPLLVTKHFGGDVLELGWIQSTMAIGIVVGGITLGLRGGFKKTL